VANGVLNVANGIASKHLKTRMVWAKHENQNFLSNLDFEINLMVLKQMAQDAKFKNKLDILSQICHFKCYF
jgi:hypothetical protein